jgi:hypothetical protein
VDKKSKRTLARPKRNLSQICEEAEGMLLQELARSVSGRMRVKVGMPSVKQIE